MAALALLEVAEADRAVRPAMALRLGEALRRLVGPAEALMGAEVVEFAPLGSLAAALVVAHGETAGAMNMRPRPGRIVMAGGRVA